MAPEEFIIKLSAGTVPQGDSQMEDQKNIVRKIRALFAKANSVDSEAEAASFVAKAQELLAKHNIELIDETVEDAKVGEKTCGFKYLSPLWTSLHGQVARLYFCDLYISGEFFDKPKQKFVKRLIFVGKDRNTEVAMDVADYLSKTIIRLSRVHSKDSRRQIDFQKGCIHGLYRRMKEMMKASISQPVGDSGGLPAIYESEQKLVRAYLDHLKLRQGRAGKPTRLTGSVQAGMEASKNISLGNQLGSSNALGQKLLG
jgi:hypothetical protein